MIYPFHCDDCNKDLEINAPMKDGPPKTVTCPDCEKPMHRVWKSASVVIPEHMKASDDFHTTISNRMKHAPRPTGRAKTFW